MTTLAERTIDALRVTHDELAGVVRGLSDEDLTRPSAASEWTVAQVLSHLGSGAEITRAGYVAALEGSAPPEQGFNAEVWDRWNARGPLEQATGSLEQDAVLVETFEASTPEQRAGVSVPVGFLPAPLSVASVAGMRLTEAAMHSWDVRVAFDPTATVDVRTAELLSDHFADGLGFLLGFAGRADRMERPAVVQVDATATFSGGVESVLRLVTGRLTPPYTPAGVEVTGDVSLEDLRRVFPGY
jgi:uncharacterized protein (TIGR03083 family)